MSDESKKANAKSPLLGCVGMGHSYDDISLFVSCVDVAVSLGNVFQWIASIDDRLYLPRLNKLFEDQ